VTTQALILHHAPDVDFAQVWDAWTSLKQAIPALQQHMRIYLCLCSCPVCSFKHECTYCMDAMSPLSRLPIGQPGTRQLWGHSQLTWAISLCILQAQALVLRQAPALTLSLSDVHDTRAAGWDVVMPFQARVAADLRRATGKQTAVSSRGSCILMREAVQGYPPRKWLLTSGGQLANRQRWVALTKLHATANPVAQKGTGDASLSALVFALQPGVLHLL
jgi:hypothetical protein